MLKQFVDVIQALLLVGLTLGVLYPAIRLATGRDPARPGPRPVVWGTVIGALLGLAMIVVHEQSIIRFDRQKLTLTTLEPTVALGIATLIFAWLGGRKTLAALAARGAERHQLTPNPITPAMRIFTTLVGTAWTVMIVFRDSQLPFMQMRTFVPVGASVFSTETFLNVVGYLGGVAVVIVGAVAMTRLCQIRPTWILPLLTVLLSLVTLTHIFLIVRLLHAIRVIYLSASGVSAMSWLINHETWLILAALALVAAFAVLTIDTARRTPITGANPARARIQRATSRAMTRRSALAAITSVVAFGALTVGERYANQEVQLSPPEPFDIEGDRAVIPLESISDGHLHRYVYDTEAGPQVRWIVIQKAGSSYGVGLDACEICGPSGYYEQDGQVICKLCSVAMNIATIGFKGGCNPIPIDFEVGNGVLAIPLAVLEESATVFA
ncbi:MAG: Fe-S-containing protein [Bowdeniella nasicola]|nr:Fe-S-containing protein [Bowdeniella nasicola]